MGYSPSGVSGKHGIMGYPKSQYCGVPPYWGVRKTQYYGVPPKVNIMGYPPKVIIVGKNENAISAVSPPNPRPATTTGRVPPGPRWAKYNMRKAFRILYLA